MTKGGYWNCLSSRAPKPSRATGFELTIQRASFNTSRTCEEIPCACTPEIFQKWPPRHRTLGICWTVLMVGWSNVTPNQNNKWCFDELMLPRWFTDVCTPLRWKPIGKISLGITWLKKLEQFKITHLGIYEPPGIILAYNSGIFDNFFPGGTVPLTAEHEQCLNSH